MRWLIINTLHRLAFVSWFSQWTKAALQQCVLSNSKNKIKILSSCLTRQLCQSYFPLSRTGKHARTSWPAKARANLGFSRLLCLMVWFLDELFHNLCPERMTCCLIHAMSEWGPFGSVYWAVLHPHMWTSWVYVRLYPVMNHIDSLNSQNKHQQNNSKSIFKSVIPVILLVHWFIYLYLLCIHAYTWLYTYYANGTYCSLHWMYT